MRSIPNRSDWMALYEDRCDKVFRLDARHAVTIVEEMPRQWVATFAAWEVDPHFMEGGAAAWFVENRHTFPTLAATLEAVREVYPHAVEVE